VLYN
jgi:hypothetical protein